MNKIMRSFSLLLCLYLLLITGLAEAQQLRSLMVNACSSGGSEGQNEYAILFNDSAKLPIDGQHIDLRYGNSFPASTTYTDSFWAVGNAGFVNALNTYLNGSCDFSVVNGQSTDSIPPNTFFIIMYGFPTDTIDFSAWCGQNIGDVYVLFSKDQSWSSSGNFVNAPSGSRFLRTDIGGVVNDYIYSNGWASNKDGNYVTWNDTGTAYLYLNYSNCTPDNLKALPVHFVSVEVQIQGESSFLVWTTASEVNNWGFYVERYSNNFWESIGFQSGMGTSSRLNTYRFPLLNREKGALYRLKQVDYDGEFSYSSIVKDDFKEDLVHFRQLSMDEIRLKVPREEEVIFWSTDFLGRIQTLPLSRSGDEWIGSLHHLQTGVYLFTCEGRNKLITKRIYIIR